MNKIFDNKQEFTELYRDAVMSISGKSVEAASDLDRFNALAKLVAEKARTVATKSDARATAEIRVAALQATPDALSDACVWSPEAAAAGEADQCGGVTHIESVPETPAASGRALVWPDDFIALTTGAVSDAWDAAVGYLTDLYEYAFESDEPARKAGS